MTNTAKYRVSTDVFFCLRKPGSVSATNVSQEVTSEIPSQVFRFLLSAHDSGVFTREEFCGWADEAEELERVAAETLFDQLVMAEVIVDEVVARDRRNANESGSWAEHGWAAAGIFHQGVVFSDFIQGDADGFAQTRIAGENYLTLSSSPEPKKSYPQIGSIRLPEPRLPNKTDFVSILNGRRTMRDFRECSPCSPATLSGIMDLTFRVKKTFSHSLYGRQYLKTSPSGGARHPVEAYVLRTGSSSDENEGVFYYDPENHSLQRVNDIQPNLVESIAQKQLRTGENAVSFLLTLRFPRNMWKYRYSKSYLFTHLDLGHVAQSLLLTCEAFEMGAFLTPALDVRRAMTLLQLEDPYVECPAYLVVAGKKDQ